MSIPLESPSDPVELLCNTVKKYLSTEEVAEVYRAYEYSAEAHKEQTRLTGEPYVYHPIAVAHILGKMRMDMQTICAALLHDVIEDTGTSKETLASIFDEKIAELVDGVSKLTLMPSLAESQTREQAKEQAKADSFQKMIMAMSQDIRVIIIKLADRLHNMRTINAMKRTSQRRIARETLEIYAPIAGRLGMNNLRIELEELSFKTFYPMRFKVLQQRMAKFRDRRQETLDEIHENLNAYLRQAGCKAKVLRRKRHHYGIYTKMLRNKGLASKEKAKTFHKVMNMYAFQIILDTASDCYIALGAVHRAYKPMTNRFKDYIALPRINGYQSLHTVLYHKYGVRINVQIRTKTMHELSEMGIIAHGLYQLEHPEQENTETVLNLELHERASKWLHSLLEMQTGDSVEFLEHVKTDLFPEEVYVFTPQGDILQLPKGATPIDLAYCIHSDVGNRCIAAKIDNIYTNLSTPLVSGQTVEILTAEWARPNPLWLDFAISARARTHIRHYLKQLRHDDSLRLGKRLLDKELASCDLSIDKLSETQITSAIKAFQAETFEQLLIEIGLGHRMAINIARIIVPTIETKKTKAEGEEADTVIDEQEKTTHAPLVINGSEGVLVNFSPCCRPIPGDDVLGFINAGSGIVIHTANCQRMNHNQPDKLVPVQWDSVIEGEFSVDICVEVENKRGVLAKIANALDNMKCNIISVNSNEKENNFNVLRFTIGVKNRVHLAEIIRHLRCIDITTRIYRVKT